MFYVKFSNDSIYGLPICILPIYQINFSHREQAITQFTYIFMVRDGK